MLKFRFKGFFMQNWTCNFSKKQWITSTFFEKIENNGPQIILENYQMFSNYRSDLVVGTRPDSGVPTRDCTINMRY